MVKPSALAAVDFVALGNQVKHSLELQVFILACMSHRSVLEILPSLGLDSLALQFPSGSGSSEDSDSGSGSGSGSDSNSFLRLNSILRSDSRAFSDRTRDCQMLFVRLFSPHSFQKKLSSD